MANYMLDVAKATMVVAGVGLTALEGAELAFIGGTNALYCRTAEQRAQSEHMCSVLGGARRDMSRGAAAIREHGVAGLVTPPTNWSGGSSFRACCGG